MTKRLLIIILVVLISQASITAHAFGPKGHQIVGAIADQVLAGKPEAAKIAMLLNNLPLSEAAKIADDIKKWDKIQHANIMPSASLPWTQDPVLFQEMKDFFLANSGHGNPNHHTFHYTDISVDSDLKYDSSKKGATKTDVVQMINVCIAVLQQANPQPNYKITPRVAVVLLSHYLGDIHQPLHVGAAYFDGSGNRVDPDQVTSAKGDTGGNDIQLHLSGSASNSMALHEFWDDNSVDAAIRKIRQSSSTGGAATSMLTDQEIKAHFVMVPPQGAPLDTGVQVKNLSVTWANEILPISKVAHDRLKFTILSPPVKEGEYTFQWRADEQVQITSYKAYSGDVVDASIHRAGWRLATLLETLF